MIILLCFSIYVAFSCNLSHFVLYFFCYSIYSIILSFGGCFVLRVYVSISDEMFEKLDYYSKKMCMSRSQLMNFLCGQGLMSLDKSMNILENMGEIVSHDLIDNSLKTLSE